MDVCYHSCKIRDSHHSNEELSSLLIIDWELFVAELLLRAVELS